MVNKQFDYLSSCFLSGAAALSSNRDMYVECGIFGSFSRGDYKCGSDVDFVIYVDKLPDKVGLHLLRDCLEEAGCDLAVLLKSQLSAPTTPFAKNVQRDYRRLYIGNRE